MPRFDDDGNLLRSGSEEVAKCSPDQASFITESEISTTSELNRVAAAYTLLVTFDLPVGENVYELFLNLVICQFLELLCEALKKTRISGYFLCGHFKLLNV